MSWRELRNAPLIEAFRVRLLEERGNIEHSGPISSWPSAWQRVVEEGREECRQEFWRELGGFYSMPADEALTALIGWDDMCAIIAMQPDELAACIHMFPGTELQHRCVAAQIFDSVVGVRRAYELCASIANREVDEGSNGAPDVAASQRGGGEESKGDRHEAP